MKTVLVIDGQGGRLGSLLVSSILDAAIPCELIAVGTNSIATAEMIKAGARRVATGENPVKVLAKSADVIMGPIGILIADALLGEVTPAMAAAVGQSQAEKLLIPVKRCRTTVVGVSELSSLSELAADAVEQLKKLINDAR